MTACLPSPHLALQLLPLSATSAQVWAKLVGPECYCIGTLLPHRFEKLKLLNKTNLLQMTALNTPRLYAGEARMAQIF